MKPRTCQRPSRAWKRRPLAMQFCLHSNAGSLGDDRR
jgi:hypothetical protein